MNCKQGDLAIIVKSYAHNEGKIVQCIKFLPDFEYSDGDRSDSWEVDIYLQCGNGILSKIIGDHQLRPIRDQDGEDEMIKLAGKPGFSDAVIHYCNEKYLHNFLFRLQ